MKQSLRLLALAAALTAAFNAHAVVDATGDFLASFTGTHNAALDIVAADVSFDAAAGNFLLHAQTSGAIAGAPNVTYVFGFNRGGTANTPFGAIGLPDIAFNATAQLRADGTGAVGANAVTPNIIGNEIFGTVSASLLPSNGFAAQDYTWALWTIDTGITGLARNADFAASTNLAVAAVPEPETYALMLAGIGVVGVVARRRSRARQE
ncbi:MAG: PEP-CTERM sorting domain-containing protein [Betaproteobacteria bacterium]|nr:MAG: PEP-CTERM sorting domain-containing protein [Betaproteobacteria bacterium]